MKRLPIGIEDFKELIDKDCYYVDKTSFIPDIINEKVALYTRPRRFGKTLNMSMLYYFFSMKQKDNAYLFNDMDIVNHTDSLQYQNQYPVIFITLKDMKKHTFENQKAMFAILIQDIVRKNQELLESEELNTFDKEQLIAYYRRSQSDVDLQNALKFLCGCLKQHYHKDVILLIDEYDVPLQSAYLKGYYDEMADFLSGMFSAALKTNDALEKGILTGCLRIAKESIFTGLNNFSVYSISEDQSSTSFGFTPKETITLLEHYDLKSYEQTIKEWYDGYLFGNKEIYNPWSVLKYVQKIKQGNDTPESFWANTSGNDIIYQYIQKANSHMREDFDLLTSGKMIEKAIKHELTYREMDKIQNIYSFLLFTGYLKVIKCIDEEKSIYQLMIPNKEINRIYTLIFEEWFQEQTEAHAENFAEALLKEDIETANKIVNDLLFTSISYFDYDEKFYHGILIGLLCNYRIMSNQESGLGRFDIAVAPRSLSDRGMILELKTATSLAELKNTAKHACKQIKDKQYIEGMLAEGYEDIIGYGIAFYKKFCVIEALKDSTDTIVNDTSIQ